MRYGFSPVRYLTTVNIIGAGLGFVQGMVNARILGPEAFGIIAVVAGINAVVLNFVDIRITDLASKLYYQSGLSDEIEHRTYQSSVIQICIVINGLITSIFSLLGLVASLLAINLFTTTPVKWEWILAHVITLALTNWMGTFQFLQRFSGKFFLMGSWRLVTRVVTMTISLAVLFYFGNLDGYFWGRLVAVIVSALITIGVSVFIWRRYEKFPLLNKQMFTAAPDYWEGRHFLFYGNLLGYAKLLHRAADVLVIAYFSDDRITGLYKFARSLTDNLYIIFDAVNQVYLPRFLELLAQKAYTEFRRLAKRALIFSGLLTLGILGLEVMLLPWFIESFLANRFAGVEGAVLILTIPLFFIMGIYLWSWPIFIHIGQLKAFATVNYLACLAQYAVIILFFNLLVPSAVGAASGYLAYYLLLIPGMLGLGYRQIPQLIPNRYRQSASV